MSEEFLENMEEIVRTSGINPKQITVEITERVFAQDFQAVKKTLNSFKEKGFSVAIDDFGTGYSCLAYLQELPVDVIKVDRTFIRGIAGNEKKKHLVEAINYLGRSLDMSVVAEGVETREEFKVLTDVGIDTFQGYLFSPPVKEEEARKILKEREKSGNFWYSFN